MCDYLSFVGVQIVSLLRFLSFRSFNKSKHILFKNYWLNSADEYFFLVCCRKRYVEF